MLKATENWLAQVDYDLATADHMLASGRLVYVVFMCHLALEKTLKAVVSEETQQLPPRIHNLIELGKRAKLTFSTEHQEFLGKINDASVITRYPDDLSREIIKWIGQDPRLAPSSDDTVTS